MKILILLTFFAFASCDYQMRSDWKEIPPASARPEIQRALKLKFGGEVPASFGDAGRIVNGEKILA